MAKWFKEEAKLVLRQSHGRSAGLHISDVIRDYAIQSKVLDKKWIRTEAIEDQDTNLMQVGLAFEDYLGNSGQHSEIEYHPGELTMFDDDYCECGHEEALHTSLCCSVDNCDCWKFRPMPIFMSPDGISIIEGKSYPHLFRKAHNFLHEFKFTKKSSRDFRTLLNQRSPKTLMWQWQIMCYCKAMGALAAKLHVLFINGDYTYQGEEKILKAEPGTSTAPYEVFRGEFTEEEIDANWVMFRNHARQMRQDRMIAA